MTTRIPIPCALPLIATLGILALLAGCSESPSDPGGGDPGGDGGTGTFTDVPEIPQPATLGGDVPARSDIATRIEPLDGAFRPLVVDAQGRWQSRTRCGGEERNPRNDFGWASAMHAVSEFREVARKVTNRRMVLLDGSGAATVPREDEFVREECMPFGPASDGHYQEFVGLELAADVHVRRDRHWELKPLEGAAGDYLLVYPNTEGEVSTSYTSGTTTSQTEEFGKSLTVTAGLSYSVLSASVSGTLSETFSSSVAVSETNSETFTKRVTGKDGKVVQFMVWELVEEYSITDADGEPLTDENYVVTTSSMGRRGVAIALQSTEFDLP